VISVDVAAEVRVDDGRLEASNQCLDRPRDVADRQVSSRWSGRS